MGRIMASVTYEVFIIEENGLSKYHGWLLELGLIFESVSNITIISERTLLN